ncbi:MAG TPA: alpha/beta hydrolase-fold protein [Mycobacteriales bacterium]|nr:alpha/beta hydrolase-fold protein [Mycobacteriales bacterium]
MEPTSSLTVACVVLAFAVGIGVTVATWDRPRWAWGRRITAVAACQLLLSSAVLLEINHLYDFVPTWSYLVGASPSAGTRDQPGRLDQRLYALAAGLRRPGHGVVLPWIFAGGHSGIIREAEVYLPAAYFDPGERTTAFPVLELFSGVPGSPLSWTASLHLGRVLDREIATGRVAPLVAVVPAINGGEFSDTECVNVVHGEQDDTYLTTDLRTALVRDFRIRRDRRGWAMAGYSTGGYCALNLAFRHPALYTAAASLSGNFAPYLDATTGALFGSSVRLEHANDPLWEARLGSVPPVALYLATAADDVGTVEQLRSFLAELRSATPPTIVIVASGGHSTGVWRALEAPMLDWLSAQLGSPAAARAPLR